MLSNDARTSLEDLLNQMREVLVVSGIQEDQIRMRSGNHKIKTCVKAFDWLHDLFMSKEYKEVKRIWDLLPAKIWARYKSFGIEDTREQNLLVAAGKKLNKKWKQKRPRLFGKDRPKDLEDIATNRMDTCRK